MKAVVAKVIARRKFIMQNWNINMDFLKENWQYVRTTLTLRKKNLFSFRKMYTHAGIYMRFLSVKVIFEDHSHYSQFKVFAS